MYINYIVYMYVDLSASPEAYGLFVLITEITFDLLNISYANNFYLYCLSGTKFRKDLKEIFNKLFRMPTD